MPEQQADTFSYDQVPYHSWPYQQSHPDRLAALATLLGLNPQPIDNARVLELGCAAGGNIIPIAETYPESKCVGVDLSSREIAQGMETIRKLGLTNIELQQANIADVDARFGRFHYIIAHGVYSWVPSNVQESILKICCHNLAENGVAYISYNTYPGWRMRGMIRDMLIYHTSQFDETEKQIEQARALLSFLADCVPTENNAYGSYLRQEVELFNQVRDDYLYHDHLEKVNLPVYFHEFISRAERHGLQYLGEAELSVMATSNFPDEIEDTLQRISRDTIQIEQYMDFLRNRTFRQTLLCSAEQKIDRSLDPRYAQNLYMASPLRPQPLKSDDGPHEFVRFSHGGVNVDTADPLVKAALTVLFEQWPRSVSFDCLLRESELPVTPDSPFDVDDPEMQRRHLAEHLIRCYASNAIEIHTTQPHFITHISQHPTATPLARLQAEQGTTATNRKHEIVNLDEVSRRTLSFLDGSRDAAGIQRELRRLVDTEQLVVKDEDVPVRESDRIDAILQTVVQQSLEQLRDAAMLIA